MSRCGISEKSTLEYKDELKEHILFISKFNEEEQCIKLFCYKIYKQNDYFIEYIHN